MNIFFTADTHFSHANIIRHCKRKYLQDGDLDDKGRWIDKEIARKRTEEMNRDMMDVWNSVVKSKDMVYILGDFAWLNHSEWAEKLHGRKILIKGNHDKKVKDTSFEEIHQLLERVICGQKITMCHYPMRSWSSSVHGSWCLCGHCHGTCKVSLPGETEGGLILDVGWDIWHKPLLFEEVATEMQKKIDKRKEGERYE